MRRRRDETTVILILILLIVVAVMLAITLFWLMNRDKSNIKEDNSQDIYSENTTGVSFGEIEDNQEIESGSGMAMQGSVPENTITQGREAYQIQFQQRKVYEVSSLENLSKEEYKVSYDLNRDGAAESITIGLSYDKNNRKLKVTLSAPNYSKVECELDNPLTSTSKVDIVGVTNNYGIGLGILSKNYIFATDQYEIQAVMWECGNSTLTEQWNVVYSSKILPNGFVGEGLVRGRIGDQKFNDTIETSQNNVIVYRSTLLSDMKKMGILLPKETLPPADITYRRYATGLMTLEIE